MTYEFTDINGQVTAVLSGGLYVEDAIALREKLIAYFDQGFTRYVVDLSRVDYIDSSGLGVLVAIQKRALQKGGGVSIKGINGTVKEIFDLTRLTKVFDII